MSKVLVAYFSETSNTEKMAELVAEGASKAGAEVTLAPVREVDLGGLPGYDGLILGSPTYYGQMAGEMKQLLDASVTFHGKLTGKAGGAFASAGVVGGGAETTVLSLIHALLIHGMVVQGTPTGGHYGPVSHGAPDDRAAKECRGLGERVARLAGKLSG